MINEIEKLPDFLTGKQTDRLWKLLYCLFHDMKTIMDVKYKEREENIDKSDIEETFDYFISAWNNILKSM